jgi:hypothetical protein
VRTCRTTWHKLGKGNKPSTKESGGNNKSFLDFAYASATTSIVVENGSIHNTNTTNDSVDWKKDDLRSRCDWRRRGELQK